MTNKEPEAGGAAPSVKRSQLAGVSGAPTQPVPESQRAGCRHQRAQGNEDKAGSRAMMAQAERRVRSGWNENHPGRFEEKRQKEEAKDASF